MPQCSVPGCTKQGGHKFPRKNPQLLKKWQVAIKREEPGKPGKLWQPGLSARVCSLHFNDDDYKTLNYYGNTPSKKELKSDAVPHMQTSRNSQSSRAMRAVRKLENELLLDIQSKEAYEFVGAMEVVDTDMTAEVPETSSVPQTSSNVFPQRSTHTQTTGNPQQLYSADKFDDDTLHYYTGLETYAKFKMVLNTLGPAVYELNYYNGVVPYGISEENQFFLTLIKLRTHSPNKELSIFFGISQKHVSNIFITWINFMFLQWEEINWWPSQELVRYFSPSDFRRKFPNTRLIVDGTEFPIMKPKQPVVQQATFSTYKNRNTMKILVGASPGGLVTYVSPAYGGSASDRQIVERSGLPQMCDPFDSIMADKGFTVDDLFLPYLTSINTPSFFKRKNRMSRKLVLNDRKIASKRVHIERIIGLAKTYKILRDPMTNMESSLATRISKVVFTLCNFRRCIVSDKA